MKRTDIKNGQMLCQWNQSQNACAGVGFHHSNVQTSLLPNLSSRASGGLHILDQVSLFLFE